MPHSIAAARAPSLFKRAARSPQPEERGLVINMTFCFCAGQRCQLSSKNNPCTSNNPCKNGGTCSGNWVNDEYVAVCACREDTYGDNCESAPPPLPRNITKDTNFLVG